jgi:hypothetical protein
LLNKQLFFSLSFPVQPIGLPYTDNFDGKHHCSNPKNPAMDDQQDREAVLFPKLATSDGYIYL